MTDHVVLIDGYNVIRRSPQLARAEQVSLQHGRDALITLLAFRYGAIAGRMVVVFDGAEHHETRTAERGISIIFSAHGCTADACIQRLAVAARAQGQRVTVVTDDNGLRACLHAAAPEIHTTHVKPLNDSLYAPDRVRAKQHRHRTAIKQIMADREDPPPRPKHGNPHRAPKK
jgi:hypothetical protein